MPELLEHDLIEVRSGKEHAEAQEPPILASWATRQAGEPLRKNPQQRAEGFGRKGFGDPLVTWLESSLRRVL